jgi:hypothetical protein
MQSCSRAVMQFLDDYLELQFHREYLLKSLSTYSNYGSIFYKRKSNKLLPSF